MASIVPGESVKHGPRRFHFTIGGRRCSVRFPAMRWGSAVAVKNRIEDLVACKTSAAGVPKDDTSKWIRDLDDTLHARLAETGLIPPRASVQLGKFIEEHKAECSDLKYSTHKQWEAPIKSLLEFFGPGKPLRDITPGDADAWRRGLRVRRGKRKGESLAENTRRSYAKAVKKFFNAAVRKHLIDANPFSDQVSTIVSDPGKFKFITRELADRILEECPGPEWRLIFALARFGGLRCPSEILALRWADVDWKQSVMRVQSPKTAHHVGKDSRLVPIFPELLPHLQEAYELAPEGAVYVVMSQRDRKANLRTQLLRIIERAGITPWPKIFQNLRSSRQTELENDYPSHVVRLDGELGGRRVEALSSGHSRALREGNWRRGWSASRRTHSVH